MEPCQEYVEILTKMGDLVVINTDWSQVPFLFQSNSVDYITIHDVIEHLTKEDGRNLLSHTIPIARKGVDVFTPIGFVEQIPGEDGLDAWGLHGGEWQRHRSGWVPEDFPGWEIEFSNPCGTPMLTAKWRVNG